MIFDEKKKIEESNEIKMIPMGLDDMAWRGVAWRHNRKLYALTS